MNPNGRSLFAESICAVQALLYFLSAMSGISQSSDDKDAELHVTVVAPSVGPCLIHSGKPIWHYLRMAAPLQFAACLAIDVGQRPGRMPLLMVTPTTSTVYSSATNGCARGRHAIESCKP